MSIGRFIDNSINGINKGLSVINNTVRQINTKEPFPKGGAENLEVFLTTPIDKYCLIDMADYQLRRHLLMSLKQKKNIFNFIGNSVSGISNKVSVEVNDYDYTYTNGNNYIDDYQKNDAKKSSTRIGLNTNNKNYTNHNQIYGQTINLYPDDDDTGSGDFYDTQKWDTYEENRNVNSILKKTKDLFRSRKINTIISRFHTDPDKLDLYDKTESATSDYGLSHGRNLLTYDAEVNHNSYTTNGYDNPYCRVWTHHHQYSQHRHRLIRPFVIEDKNGNSVNTNENLHKWNGFTNTTYNKVDEHWTKESWAEDELKVATKYKTPYVLTLHKAIPETWGWKDKGAKGWAMSVLDRETGLVNIAPKYLGGADKNVHPKDCMFSIENLAWQGYDPYSFERALSWEQRGPFGGRIMWFPPYGLRFNEDTSVQWNEHTFIGRGENVYTYTNTSRSGTLEFMMVVDHPSILDYATWYGESQPDKLPKDTDVLRFLAGCDSGNSNDSSSLLSYVKPTPLTDEYLSKKELKDTATPTPEEKPAPEQPQQKPIESSDEPINISFYVFYPNNYSGYFDRKPDSKVDPIAYLLCGNGAQWKCDVDNVKKSSVLSIKFDDLSDANNSNSLGAGYEMVNSHTNQKTQYDNKNFIIGANTENNPTKYTKDEKKLWYYRIDGEYVDKLTNKEIKNCFAQTLKGESYQDKISYNLNWDIKSVKEHMDGENNNKYLYTLAEVACALTTDANAEFIKNNTGNLDDNRINELKNYFGKANDNSGYKVIEISGIGYSNSHDFRTDKVKVNVKEIPLKVEGNEIPLNDARNIFLANERCNTAIKWFKDLYKCKLIDGGTSYQNSKQVENNEDESGLSAKKWRSAKITLKIQKSKTENKTEEDSKNSQNVSDNVTIPKSKYDSLQKDEQNKYETVMYSLARSAVKRNDNKAFIDATEYNELTKEEQESYSPSAYKLKEGQQETQPKLPNGNTMKIKDFTEVEVKNGVQLYINNNENDPAKKGRRWVYNKEKNEMQFWDDKPYGRWKNNDEVGWKSKEMHPDLDTEKVHENTLRYDQEYHFFKKLNQEHPDVFASLVEKLQYFDPAFHSMTPEGFMGRLNFLHQCTRQGDTVSASDENGHTANNLAFGRPPFCVLRLGDFYYQKIVIKNINISYDPLVLDLNNEGVGVVPLIANVTISFNFIGGGDLSGPVRRLQNAMSENYYANGRLYNNRADRIERDKKWDTMETTINWAESYHHHVKMSE